MSLGKHRKTTAIITARGGSKSLPRKNILPLAGRALIQYSIEAALQCKWIDRCVVSTDDSEIKRVSLSAGAEVIDRPADLATDHALSEDAVIHALNILKNQGRLQSEFVLLQPTSPLRNSQHLTRCLEAYYESSAESCVSVCAAEHHPYKTLTLEGEYLKPLFDETVLAKPRQQLPKVYRPNGAIFLTRTETFLKTRDFYAGPVLPFLMEQEESIDVDTALDMKLCELILAQRR